MDVCRRNGHPKTPENTYVNPKTGNKYCVPCARESRRRSRNGCQALKVGRPPGGNIVLTQAQIDSLRAAVACVGCGAVRKGRRGKPTTIEHKARCRVYALELEEKRVEELKSRTAAWTKRRKTVAA